MAEVIRKQSAVPEVSYCTDYASGAEAAAGNRADDGRLRADTASSAETSNPALTRSAAAIGRGVGAAVAEARRLPRQLNRLGSRIHLVREKPAALQDSPEAKAFDRRDAENHLLELADKAAVYTSALGERAGDRLQNLRRAAWWKLEALRKAARHRTADVREWKPERAMQIILMSASAAFALGVMLRIWGAGNE